MRYALVFSALKVISWKNGFPCFVYVIKIFVVIINNHNNHIADYSNNAHINDNDDNYDNKLFIDVLQWWIKVENEETPDHPDVSFSNFEQFYSSF